jgi:hypothetical protein
MELLEQLENECMVQDWYYNYSDQHSKWQAGFDRKQRIRSLLEKLDYSKEAVAIHNKYAPHDFQLDREFYAPRIK